MKIKNIAKYIFFSSIILCGLILGAIGMYDSYLSGFENFTGNFRTNPGFMAGIRGFTMYGSIGAIGGTLISIPLILIVCPLLYFYKKEKKE